MSAAGHMTGMLRSLLGPSIWFLCLGILYAIVTAACAGLIASGGVLYVLAAWITLLASAAILTWIMISGAGNRRRYSDSEFVALLTQLLAALSLIGTLWFLVPLTILPVCGG